MKYLYLYNFRGFAQNSLAASSVAFTQASKDCLSPYISETMKELQLIKTYAYGFGTLLTSLKLDQIFSQYNHELNVFIKINKNRDILHIFNFYRITTQMSNRR